MKTIITLCITLIAVKAFCPIIVRNDIESSKYFEFAKKPFFNCVGAVYENNKFMASCVLVEENIILTDAHVLEDFKNGSIYEVKFNQQLIKVRNVVIHPKYDRKKINVDLAVALLESKVKNVIPASIYDGKNELEQIGYFCGFGIFSIAGDSNESFGTKVAGTNMIDQIGGMVDSVKYGEHELLIDFDVLNSDKCNSIGASNPLELEMIPTGGDSGGGMFIKIDNEYFLAGLYIYRYYFPHLNIVQRTITEGDSTYTINIGTYKSKCDKKDYGQIASFTRLSDFTSWIKKAIKKLNK